MKGNLVEFNKEIFKEINDLDNLEEFKLNCLKNKVVLFSDEEFEIVFIQNCSIMENNSLKFTMVYFNLGKNFIEDFNINYIKNEKG